MNIGMFDEELKPANVPVVIRRMTLDDLEQVVTIDQLSFTTPWPAHSYRFELLENKVSLQWVAVVPSPEANAGDRRQPVLVGLVVAWLIEDEAHIATIAVHPDYRGSGIGKQLLVVALRELTQRGANSVTLEVREHNEVAIAMYRQFGFEVVGRRPRYYKDTNEAALLMTVKVSTERHTENHDDINSQAGAEYG